MEKAQNRSSWRFIEEAYVQQWTSTGDFDDKDDCLISFISYLRELQKHSPTPQFLAHSNRPRLVYVSLLLPHTGLYSDVTGQFLMQAAIAN